MKTKSIVKLILDVVMSVLILLLLFPNGTGLAFHEIIGLSVVFMFAAHLLLNAGWIVNVTKVILSGKVKNKALLMYLLNAGMLIGVLVIAITGVMISSVVFSGVNYSQHAAAVHTWAAYITAAMITAHIAVHAKYLVTGFKKILSSMKSQSVSKTLGGTFAVMMVAVIIYFNVISAAGKDITLKNPVTADNNSLNNEITAFGANKKDDEETSIVSTPETAVATMSSTEYLSKIFCTACPKHCPLSNPQCGKSRGQIAAAMTEYQKLYGSN